VLKKNAFGIGSFDANEVSPVAGLQLGELAHGEHQQVTPGEMDDVTVVFKLSTGTEITEKVHFQLAMMLS